MTTLSVHVTQLDKDDEALYCYDELSMIMLEAMKCLELYDHKLVNITDYYGKDKEELKKAIKTSIKSFCEIRNDSEDCIIVIGVEPSSIEFPDINENSVEEEIYENITDALLRDCVIMEQLGFKQLAVDLGYCIPYVYPNLVGLDIIKYFESLQRNEEEQQ